MINKERNFLLYLMVNKDKKSTRFPNLCGLLAMKSVFYSLQNTCELTSLAEYNFRIYMPLANEEISICF